MPVSKHNKVDRFNRMTKSHKVWKKRQNLIKIKNKEILKNEIDDKN